ncbi:MAG TPA: 5-(carboxyamino)imidazole ribonucleotide synthase [Gemmatimonadaceae bacterium]
MKVGVLGGGQLGQMLAEAGRRLGIGLRFLAPDAESPAGRRAELVVAQYDNEAALTHFIDGLDVVTYEFENIPIAAVRSLAERTVVRPSVEALETAQDRANEKACFETLGIPTPRWAAAGTLREARAGLELVGIPAMLKTRRHGYDGKGQAVIRERADVERGWVTVSGAPSVVESLVSFTRELSIIAARSVAGDIAFYPLVENHHSEGILRFSLAPAPNVSESVQKRAREYAGKIMEHLGYVGVMAIEFFEVPDGLLANEMAPRVHNSGHWSIEGADTSQFENHLRAVTGMELGSTEMHGVCGMVNVIGQEPDVARLREIPDVHVHMYGKAPAPRRKLGHITVTADDLDGVRRAVAQVRAVLARK